MRKTKLFFIFFILLPNVIFAQFFAQESFGYNTIEYPYSENDVEKKYREYFLLNNPRYSNVRLNDMDEKEPAFGIRYEIDKGDTQYPAYISHLTLIISLFGVGDHTSWRGDGRIGTDQTYYRMNAERTDYLPTGMIKYYRNGMVEKFYNIPEFEVEQKYLTEFVGNMITILSDECIVAMREEYERFGKIEEVYFFLILLPHFTKYELAIIRNCLFAKRGYAFQASYWKRFIETYYSENYKGFYTDSEVMENFSENEKWLLELILEYENK